MLENFWFKKEKPLLGLTGMGGGAGSSLVGGFPGTTESYEYFYDGTSSTTITVPWMLDSLKVAGVAAGSPGYTNTTGPGGYRNGTAGGGGGAGNLSGYTVPNPTVKGQTIYIGTSPNGPSYIKTGSHSGTAVWEAGAGGISSGGSMIAGPGTSGGDGGSGGGHRTDGNPGSAATNAGSGGGGGGGHSSTTGTQGPGGSGGTGGATSISSAITPLGVGPAPAWTITGTPGGGGGGAQSAGGQAPTSGAGGGAGGSPLPGSSNGGGGGGGGGVVIYGSSYGGGGGGYGNNSPNNRGTGGSGTGGFLIIQLTYYV